MDGKLMSLLDGLRNALESSCRKIDKLLELEDEKYSVLKQVEIHKLMDINVREDEIIGEMEQIEQKRAETIEALSEELGFNSDAAMSEVIGYLPLDLQPQFSQLRDLIKSKTGKLEITIRENSRLISANLDIINFTLGLTTRRTQGETYNYRNHPKKSEGDKFFMINQIA